MNMMLYKMPAPGLAIEVASASVVLSQMVRKGAGGTQVLCSTVQYTTRCTAPVIPLSIRIHKCSNKDHKRIHFPLKTDLKTPIHPKKKKKKKT